MRIGFPIIGLALVFVLVYPVLKARRGASPRR
jgi:asparagine N-glycosylation enzyme membrane subunit Stt3